MNAPTHIVKCEGSRTHACAVLLPFRESKGEGMRLEGEVQLGECLHQVSLFVTTDVCVMWEYVRDGSTGKEE